MKEDHVLLSNGRVQIKERKKERNQSCRKERLNVRRLYIFVEWSRAYKINISVVILYSGEWSCILLRPTSRSMRDEGSISSYPFIGNCSTINYIFPVLSAHWKWGRGVSLRVSSYCLCLWCESRDLGGRGSSRIPCVTQTEYQISQLEFLQISAMEVLC